jgi:murein DD-endopeptidase MepM/ murein hydrolase activator NlpD
VRPGLWDEVICAFHTLGYSDRREHHIAPESIHAPIRAIRSSSGGAVDSLQAISLLHRMSPRVARNLHRICCIGVFLALGGTSLGAQQSRLTITPARPLPGTIVRLTVTNTGAARDSIVAITGTMAGEPLHFAWNKGRSAIGAVPVDSVHAVMATVVVKHASGRAESLHVSVTPPPLPPPKEQLNVAARFGRPLDSATEARVAREGALAAAVGRRSHDSPPRWTQPFLRPRASAVSSGFGTGRMFNGQVASRHLGVDFRGATGAPIRAANRGVVVLVDTFFLAGRCVYIDHGGGVTTGYFHMSRALVSVGDTVARGQTIGLVGATGRVTGPHLHWAARYGALTVNPLGLLTLGDSTRRAEPTRPRAQRRAQSSIPHVQRRRPPRAP